MQREQLLLELEKLLRCNQFKDYAPNGLQIEGAAQIKSIVTAVTASQAAIKQTIKSGAQALIVHHGYFWKGEETRILGIKKQRLALLLNNNINLIAYHIPLDQHPLLGNNALFANNFKCLKVWQSEVQPLIWHAKIQKCSGVQLLRQLTENLPCMPREIAVSKLATIERIAWCSGAAQDFLTLASCEGAQVFISGEYAERSYHEALESNCAFIACGHHASERAGIRALGEYIEDNFALPHFFFNEDNPF